MYDLMITNMLQYNHNAALLYTADHFAYNIIYVCMSAMICQHCARYSVLPSALTMFSFWDISGCRRDCLKKA